jgi:hypothetical protein
VFYVGFLAPDKDMLLQGLLPKPVHCQLRGRRQYATYILFPTKHGREKWNKCILFCFRKGTHTHWVLVALFPWLKTSRA